MVDYVIISSDDNPMYKDFYPIVAKRWNQLGFKTYYVNITDEDSIEEDEWGIVHKMKSLNFVSTGFQSQVVRLYCANLISGIILTSDIDMLPINGEYFKHYFKEYQSDKILIYSGQPYGNVPYYPMCYVLGHTDNFRDFLEIRDLSFSEYCKELLKYGEAWNTDEHFMYDKFQSHLDNLVVKNDRDFSKRIDRGNWNYNINLLQTGYYIDSHMLRPYDKYKSHVDNMIKSIKN
jgi:hypothetical protein